MATKTQTIVTVESDLSGKAEASTMTFAIEDAVYEIDLTEVEQADFKELFAKYISAGREYTPRAVPPTTPAQREEIRTWLRANGIEVADTGRIPKRALNAWIEAGRPVVPVTREARRRRTVPDMTPAQREEIRTWLRANGIEVATAGRIRKDALNAWNEAHPDRQFTL